MTQGRRYDWSALFKEQKNSGKTVV